LFTDIILSHYFSSNLADKFNTIYQTVLWQAYLLLIHETGNEIILPYSTLFKPTSLDPSRV